jgi:hypothetical protein
MARLIDQEQVVRVGGGRAEMVLTVLLALPASGFCLFVALK